MSTKNCFFDYCTEPPYLHNRSYAANCLLKIAQSLRPPCLYLQFSIKILLYSKMSTKICT